MDDKNPMQKPPAYVRTALIWGGVIFVTTLFLLLWIFEAPLGKADASQPVASMPPLEKRQLDLRPLLVLDAGHGDWDPGAIDATGNYNEAVLNQEMVGRVTELLAEHEHELRVAQAHEPGTYATPMARADAAARQDADLFVSLHLNADEGMGTRGFQVFPAPPGRAHHAGSLRFAEAMVAQADGAGAHVLGSNGVYYCFYPKLAGGGYGKLILDSAELDAPREDESFGVIEYPGCPAALVELWHISSMEDMRQWNNENGKDKMATAVYLAICDYFELAPLHALEG